MTAVASTAPSNASLSQWLRLLWDVAAPLQFDAETPYIAGGTLHLPPRGHWRQHAAAAAHAASHLVYSPASFDGAGQGPIVRALVALLEDARVETLALRELPGLGRLWRPLHTATPALGSGFEALMQRLARALIDPQYDDPDPWVRKGKALFYLDAGLALLALRTPAEVRRAATLLGHDIGQMRLPFNARTYRPAPSYRDDHRWMWAAEVQSERPPPAATARGEVPPDDDGPPDGTPSVAWHPEWDHLISHLRRDWCRVVELQPAPSSGPRVHAAAAMRHAGLRLQAPLRALMHHTSAPRVDDEGESFDLAALVDWRIARRMGLPPDARVHLRHDRRALGSAVWLLIDQSASTAAAHGARGDSVLQGAVAAAAAAASALQAIGVPCAVSGFNSHGRHTVRLQLVKDFDAPADAFMVARLQALRPGGSTRLGAALRHATGRLCRRNGRSRWVLVLSDGEPFDIDVHEPRYLVEDARHAVRSAGRAGVRMACVVLAPQCGMVAKRIFGRRGVHALQEIRDLPRTIHHLLAAASPHPDHFGT